MSKFIVVVGGIPESLLNFRGELICAFKRSGLRVMAMSSPASDKIIKALNSIGIEYTPYDLKRNSLNPLNDLSVLVQLYKVFRYLKADLVLAYTIKPVIWGGFAARVTGAEFYALITGLGYSFQGEGIKRSFLKWLVRNLYRSALVRAKGVIFQNADNAKLFIDQRIVHPSKCHVVNGSGVNLNYFNVQDFPGTVGRNLVFLCVSRLLKEKGLREYASAAKIVKQIYPQCSMQLVGPEDSSPDGISISEVEGWNAIEYLGVTSDVRPLISGCHVYVLPSYHEGLPRSTLEAMSMGRPVITTNAVGCRDTVIEGENGFMVPVKDTNKLAERMMWCIEHANELEQMGRASRKLVERRFDVRIVNDDIMRIMGIDC